MVNVVGIWILLSTLLVASGRILSAIHELNAAGYGIIFAAAGTALFIWRQQIRERFNKYPAQWFHKFRRRCRRIAPMIFLALVLMTLLAGALYAPSNGSSTGYRIPRVMHWLAAEQWQWIRTSDTRMNIAGSGMEWLFAPLILLTHGDRLLFLPNWISFFLLPGLIFSVFTRLGVRPRVAWWWMWILPSGWCFIMQAASTINDTFGTVYALAAVDFALRAREDKKIGNLWLAMLAAALATGVKQTYVLLALPALIAIWPSVRLLLKRPLSSLAIAAICLIVSAGSMMIYNLQNTGSWSGVTEKTWGAEVLNSPVWAVIGNVFYLTVQNVKPPVFPLVNWWNASMHHFLQTSFGAHFRQFEDFGWLSFGVGESSASLGAGISLLILISIFAARHYRRKTHPAGAPVAVPPLLRLLHWTPWAILIVFMAKVGNAGNGRLIAPYYFFLFPSLLILRGQSMLVRQRWWQWAAICVLLLAAMLVVISRDRPLFPAQTIISRLDAKYPDSKLVSSISKTYSEVATFGKEREFFRKILPSDATVIGYAALSNEEESLLWLPYGQRRVEAILPEDTPEQLRRFGIKYAIVCQEKFLSRNNETIQQWIARYNGVLITQWEFVEDPYEPPERYYLVRL